MLFETLILLWATCLIMHRYLLVQWCRAAVVSSDASRHRGSGACLRRFRSPVVQVLKSAVVHVSSGTGLPWCRCPDLQWCMYPAVQISRGAVVQVSSGVGLPWYRCPDLQWCMSPAVQISRGAVVQVSSGVGLPCCRSPDLQWCMSPAVQIYRGTVVQVSSGANVRTHLETKTDIFMYYMRYLFQHTCLPSMTSHKLRWKISTIIFLGIFS